MSNIEILDKIKELGQQAASLLNGKEFFLGEVVNRFRTAASKYPHDQAIRTMQVGLEQKLGREGSVAIYSQASLQNMYDEVSGLGNREAFMEELGDLLLENRVTPVAHYNDDFVRGLRNNGEELEITNKDEVNTLASMWDEDPSARVVKSSFVESGRRGVEIELESLGFVNPTVEVAASDSNFVVYAAEVDNRRGRIPFMVPAEIKLGSVLMPSVFVAGDEFQDLTKVNLQTYVNDIGSVAGSATPKGVLDTLNRLTGNKESKLDKQASVSNFDNVLPEGQMLFSTSFLGHTDQSLNEVNEIDVKAPEVPLPPALAGLGESVIRETLVEAGLSYSRDLVVAAKELVGNELKLANIPHDRIVIESEFTGGITVATNITGKGGKKRIEVPVEIANDQVLMPNSFTSGAMAGPFNETSLRSFANKVEGAEFDPFLSDKYDMNFNQLHTLALRKAAYGDFIEATEILSIVNDKFGPEYHKMAHDDLMGLMRIGYSEEEKPLTAMEKFTQTATKAAEERAERMAMSDNPMLFYPKE